MKVFTKLALASSVALSANAMAMQALEDADLSTQTGQAGITISIDTTDSITIDKLLIHDNDGFANETLTFGEGTGQTTIQTGDGTTAGAITVTDISIAKASTNTGNLVDLTIDAGVVGTSAVLNILAETGAMDIDIGSIGVAGSGTYDEDLNTRGITAGSEKEILSDISLSLGAVKANIQLGNAPQGAMIVVDSQIDGGLVLNSLTLNDTSTSGQGSIGISGLKVTTAGQTYLNADAKIGVRPTGLYIETASSPQNVYIAGLTLGTTDSIGAVEVQGLNMGASTIIVKGH